MQIKQLYADMTQQQDDYQGRSRTFIAKTTLKYSTRYNLKRKDDS
jgi:hypothetical protein